MHAASVIIVTLNNTAIHINGVTMAVAAPRPTSHPQLLTRSSAVAVIVDRTA